MNSDTSMKSIIHHVTQKKLQKLQSQKETLEKHFGPVLETVKSTSSSDPLKSLKVLQNSLITCPIKDIDNTKDEESQLKDLDVLIRLGENDPAGSGTYEQIMQRWVRELTQKIKFKLQKCDYSYLYGSIMNEYLEGKRPDQYGVSSGSGDASNVKGSDSDSKEKDATIQELKDRIFTSSEVNKEKFRGFLLEKVFNFKDFEEKKFFEDMQTSTKEFGKRLSTTPIYNPQIQACIKGLCSQNLLSEQKKATLKELEQNEVALTEVATLLTDYVTNFASWNWPAPVPIDFRRNMAGKYRAFMDEDIITAILLQYIGVQWSIFFKDLFLKMYEMDSIWQRQTLRSCRDSIEKIRKEMDASGFLTVLPKTMEDQYFNYEGNDSNEASDTFFDGDEEDRWPTRTHVVRRNRNPNKPTPVDVKQSLLHVISTEIQLNKVINPDNPFTVVQTDIEWFGPSLSHQAILVLFQVLGVPDEWLSFFQRFLEAPLILGEQDKEVRIRKKGVAISHMLSTLFGEALLFVMDFYVHRKGGITLHRIHDDFWLWDNRTENVIKAWEAIEEYTTIAGLKLNAEKSGSIVVPSTEAENSIIFGKAPLPQKQIKWGFIQLFSDGQFRINHENLRPYIDELTQILEQSTTIVEWVNTYNKYMAFFIRNFGKCALTFGTKHIQQIIQALQLVTSETFKASGGSPVRCLQSKFKILAKPNLLEGWVYWPVKRGGLGLNNPIFCMTSLLKTYQDLELQEEQSFRKLPEADLSIFKKLVKEAETRRQKSKYKRPNIDVSEMLTDSDYSDDEDDSQLRVRKYLKFEEVCKKSREARWYHWAAKYRKLLEGPNETAPSSYGGRVNWLETIYGPELEEYFGTIDFINKTLIPVSLISIMQSSRVKY